MTTNTTPRHLYADSTGHSYLLGGDKTGLRYFHNKIVEAINNGGEFDEDLADTFKLTKNPEGSSCEYALTWA